MGETGLHYVPMAFQCIYGCNDERGENGDGKEGSEVYVAGGENGEYLISCMEMTWFCVVSRRRT